MSAACRAELAAEQKRLEDATARDAESMKRWEEFAAAKKVAREPSEMEQLVARQLAETRDADEDFLTENMCLAHQHAADKKETYEKAFARVSAILLAISRPQARPFTALMRLTEGPVEIKARPCHDKVLLWRVPKNALATLHAMKGEDFRKPVTPDGHLRSETLPELNGHAHLLSQSYVWQIAQQHSYPHLKKYALLGREWKRLGMAKDFYSNRLGDATQCIVHRPDALITTKQAADVVLADQALCIGYSHAFVIGKPKLYDKIAVSTSTGLTTMARATLWGTHFSWFTKDKQADLEKNWKVLDVPDHIIQLRAPLIFFQHISVVDEEPTWYDSRP